MKIRKLTEKDVEFTVEALPEELDPRGNVMASGDYELDRACEDNIISDYNSGNMWAWCTIKVTASWNDLEGVDYLGGCSYKSEQDFTEGDSGYFSDLKNNALERLNEKIAGQVDKIKELIQIA